MSSFQTQGDSALGYQVIRKIVAALKKQILDTPPPRKAQKAGVKRTASGSVVEVRYILVTPRANDDPVQEKKWRPPDGCNDNCKINDHRGDVYWLDLIIMVCSPGVTLVSLQLKFFAAITFGVQVGFISISFSRNTVHFIYQTPRS